MAQRSDRTGNPGFQPGAAALDRIAAAARGIRFGSVEIVIHDGAIVQIERKEKVRLDASRRSDGDEQT